MANALRAAWSYFFGVAEREIVAVEPSVQAQYKRLQAPLLSRPSGLVNFADYSWGGESLRVRTYSDESHNQGEMLELEVFVGEQTVVFQAQVAWVQPLETSAPARYDIGLNTLPLAADASDKLSLVLI